MALPDSGNPADYTPEQIEELLATPKEGLTKNQRAALARHNFQKAKAAQAAAGGATTTEGVPVPASPQAPAPAGVPAKAAAPKAPPTAGFAPTPEQVQAMREAAQAHPDAVALRDRFPDAVLDLVMMKDKPCLVLKPGSVPDVLGAAHEGGYRYLCVITAADYPPERIETVYVVQDLATKRYLAAKTRLPRAAPRVRSVSHIWPGATWLEREVYDMFGVRFEGLADHRRLLLPDGWSGHPLLKDYDATKEQYVALDEDGEDVVTFEEAKGW